MRLLFFNPVGAIGGAERVLLEMLRGFRLHRPEWRLKLITLTDGPLVEASRALGVDAIAYPMPAAMAAMGDSQPVAASRLARMFTFLSRAIRSIHPFTHTIRRLREAVRNYQPDLIHSNGIKAHLFVRGLGYRGPILWHIHDYYSLRSRVRSLLAGASAGVKSVIAISNDIARDVRTVLPSLPVSVILNSVDTHRFSPDVQPIDLDELAQLPRSESNLLRIGLIATYARWKGQDLFLRSIQKLIALYPDRLHRFYIIGGPIYRTAAQWSLAQLESLANQLGIRSSVGFVPFQSQPERVYPALDILVHASIQPEPFGLTIIEAMSSGRPVIVSRAGGAAEIFTDGFDGLGFEPGSESQLIAVTQRLIDNPSLRQRLSMQARTTAISRFSTDRFHRELLECFEAILYNNRSNT